MLSKQKLLSSTGRYPEVQSIQERQKECLELYFSTFQNNDPTTRLSPEDLYEHKELASFLLPFSLPVILAAALGWRHPTPKAAKKMKKSLELITSRLQFVM